MFVVSLFYKKDLDAIEASLQSHRDYLERYYAEGVFLASGPKSPRSGGVILASGRISRDRLDAILEEDPFKRNGIADYEVTEFAPTKHVPAFAGLL